MGACALLLLLGAHAAAAAQDAAATGRLVGRITDSSGAPLPGITLIVTGEALAEPRTVVTGADGRFEMTGLPRGAVSVTCEAPGFVQWRREGVQVGAGAPTTLNVTMRRPPEVTGAIPPSGSRSGGGPGGPTAGPPEPVVPGAGPTPRPDPVPPPLTSPAQRLIDEISSFVDQLPSGSIAFNAPDQMHARETTDIRLLLSPVLPADALADKLQGLPGTIQTETVRIAPRMEAVLTGQGFEITAITPALQAITRGEPTEWRWQVTPRATGAQRLHLVLNVTVDGTSRTLQVFERVIQVDVTWRQQIASFVGDNWQWLWATVLVPLAGWAWRRRSLASRPEQSASGR